jgi:hypothetical protein
VEGNDDGRGGAPAEGASEVDGEVHGVNAQLKGAVTGPKDGRSGPSMWRRLAANGEPAAAACAGGQGGQCPGWGAARGPGEARGGERILGSWWLGCGITEHAWSEQRRAKRKKRSPLF